MGEDSDFNYTPLAEHAGVTDPFSNQTSMLDHVRGIHHRGNRTPCERQGCDQTSCKRGTMLQHLAAVHEGRRYPCKELGCGKTFSTTSGMVQHWATVHKGRRYPCKELGCGKTFRTTYGMVKHWATVHKGIRYPCKEQGCGKTFRTTAGMLQHLAAVHKGIRYPCEAPGCGKTYGSATALWGHWNSKHRGEQAPREQQGSEQIVRTRSNTVHPSNRIPGEETLSEAHQNLSLPCYHLGCQMMAATTEELATHLSEVHGVCRVCMNPLCSPLLPLHDAEAHPTFSPEPLP